MRRFVVWLLVVCAMVLGGWSVARGQTDLEAGWTRQGDIGVVVAALLDEATVLEGLAAENAGWPV